MSAKLATRDSRTGIAPDVAMLCAALLIAPQLFGGAFSWAIVTIAMLALATLATAIWVRRAAASPVVDALFAVMLLAWLWTCIQAVPLSRRVADGLALASIQTVERLKGLGWVGEITLAISRDPGSTQLSIVVGIAILAAFLTARLIGPAGLRAIAVAAASSSVLMGVVGIAHLALGANSVFGLYSPRFSAPKLLTPLMNGNHLGGFSLMGALIAAGLALSAGRGGKSSRVWIAAAIFCAIVAGWTFSRGAMGGLLFGFALLAAWLFGVRRERQRSALIPLTVVVAGVAGVATFVGLEPILRRFETQGFDKIKVAARALELLEGSSWWLGIGRGAFSSVFVTKEGSLARYTHPENILVQWVVEWGVVVAGALLLVLVSALWKRFRTTDDPLVASVCIAVFSLSLQNLVDFSLEIAGVAFVVAALLGSVTPVTHARTPHPRRQVVPIACLALLAVVLGVLGPKAHRSDTQFVIDTLTQSMRADEEEKFLATLQQGLALHPGEPALALLAGTYASSKQHADAAKWLSIAMQQAPGWAAPHAVAARLLLASGRTDQALLEIREAEERQAGSGHDVICEVLEQFPQMQYVDRAAPIDSARIAYLNKTSTCPELPRELRVDIDHALLEAEPTHPAAALRESTRLSQQNRPEEALETLQRAADANPDQASLWAALVRAHLDQGDTSTARSVLDQARARGLESRPLLEAQARVQRALGETDGMRATLARLRGQARGESRLIASSFILEGELEASLGNVDEALRAYTAADDVNPSSPALQRAASLALESGRVTSARRTYRTLCSREPNGAACAVEARLSEGSLERPATAREP